MKVRMVVIAVGWLLSGFLQAQAQSQPCGCANKELLLNALSMSEAAIQELNSQLKWFNERERESGGLALFSDDGHQKLWNNIYEILGPLKEGEWEIFGDVELQRGDCSIKEKGGESECARQIAKSRVDVLKKACDETKNLPLKDNPYRYMKPVILNHISGFQAIQSYVLKTLKALPKSCRPNDWFGYVYFRRNVTTAINKTVQPQNTERERPDAGINIVAGGSDTKIEKHAFIATIVVEEGKAANATGYAAQSLDESKTVTGRVYCSPTKPNVSLVKTSGTKNFIEGEHEGRAEFRLSLRPDKGKYYVHVGFFPVIAAGELSNFDTIAGGCGGKPSERSFPLTNIRLKGPDYYRLEEDLKGSPDYLQGSKLEKPPSGNSSTQEGSVSINRAEEIEVRWMLRRLPLK